LYQYKFSKEKNVLYSRIPMKLNQWNHKALKHIIADSDADRLGKNPRIRLRIRNP